MSFFSRVAAGCALVIALLLCSSTAAPAALGATCAGADDRDGTPSARTAALRCLTARVRHTSGRAPLKSASSLSSAAAAKARAIERCGTFSHSPCGAASPLRRGGCLSVAENLEWVTLGATPREVLQGWLKSPGHRANLLSGRYRNTGIARRVVKLPDAGRVELWVQQFGFGC